MLILLSPAKTITESASAGSRPLTEPFFAPAAADLVQHFARCSQEHIAATMKVSPTLAQQVCQWWAAAAAGTAAKLPAALAYNGPAFAGLAAHEWSPVQADRASERVRILSGLYGALRPFDAMVPYRLEIGLPQPGPWGANLYAKWSAPVQQHLTEHVAATGLTGVLNVASAEYTKMLALPSWQVPVCVPVFQDQTKQGTYKVISSFAKRARGMMASWCVRHNVTSAADVVGFAEAGYQYCAEESTELEPVFRRAPNTVG